MNFSTTPATCTAPILSGHLFYKILHVAVGVKYFDAHDQAKPHFEAVTRRPTQAEGWQQCVGADDALQNGTFRNWDVVNCGYCGYVMLCDVM